MTTVADVMTRGVKTLSPLDTVAQAAQAMAELNVGSIPVCDGRKLQGIVTDRDITVRVVAKGLDPLADLSGVVLFRQIQGKKMAAAYDMRELRSGRVEVIALEVEPQVLRARNRSRAVPVPDPVIDRLIRRWETPDPTEAHEVSWLVNQ
jgi:CBS domain-containing protein